MSSTRVMVATGLTRGDVLDNITLFWLTNTAVSATRLYWPYVLIVRAKP
jgi:hypothetical protein